MKKGPKTALIAVLALLAILGAALLYVSTQLDSIVAGLIEEHGSAATGTAVRVGGVSIRLKDASAELGQLSVANPEGFDGPPAIELGQFAIRIDPASITSDTVVIDDVTVSGARLRVLQQGAGNNLRKLLDNLTRDSGTRDASTSSGGKKIIIERFTLEDARAFVSLPDLGEEREVAVPTIVLNDIGRATNGATVAAATRQILEPILRRTLQTAAAQSVMDKAREKIDESKDKLVEGVLDRLGDKEDDNE